MISKKINDFASAISFRVENDSAYGFVNDFLVSVYEKGSKTAFYIYYTLDTSIPNEDGQPVSIMSLSGSLNDILKKASYYSLKEDGLEVVCTLTYVEFYNLIKEITMELSNVDAILKNCCSQCLEEIKSNTKKYRISKDFKNHLLCQSCAAELLDDDFGYDGTANDISSDNSQIEASSQNDETVNENSTLGKEPITDIEENDKPKKTSIIKGIFGSLLLSLGIGICLVLLYSFVIPIQGDKSTFKPGYYVNWLCAFIGVASFLGYKIFSKEEMKTKQIIISSIISVAVTFVSQYFASVALFARENIFIYENITFSRFTKTLPYLLKIPFTDSNANPDFKIYLIMDIIFVFLAFILISFFTAPKVESKIVIEEI